MKNLQIIREQEVLGQDFKIYGDFGNPLFLAKDVAIWIEHSRPSEMILNIDEDEKLMQTILASGQNREMWFLTENGLYEVLFQSRKPIAKAFKKEVKSILKEIRKTGIFSTENLSLELQAIILHDKKLTMIESHVSQVEKGLKEFKEELPLLALDCERITKAVKTKGVSCLGGKNALAYNDGSIRSKVYSDIYNELKRQLGVTSYKSIRRNECDTAVHLITDYSLPFSLKNAVNQCNFQKSL